MIYMLVILLIIGIGTIYLSSRHHNDIEEYQVDGLSIQHQFLTVNLIHVVEKHYQELMVL